MQLNINMKRKLMYEITSLQSYCVLLSRIELPIINLLCSCWIQTGFIPRITNGGRNARTIKTN